MKKYRILSFLMVLCVLCGVIALPTAAENSETQTEDALAFSYDQVNGAGSLVFTNPIVSAQSADYWETGYDIKWNSQNQDTSNCARLDFKITMSDESTYTFGLQNKYYSSGFYPVARFYSGSTQLKFSVTNEVCEFNSTGANWIEAHKLSTKSNSVNATNFRIRISYDGALCISVKIVDGTTETDIYTISTANTTYSSEGGKGVIQSITFSKGTNYYNQFDISNVYVKNGTTEAKTNSIVNYKLGDGWTSNAVETWIPTFSYDQDYGTENMIFTNPAATSQTASDWEVGYDIKWKSAAGTSGERLDFDIITADGSNYAFDLQHYANGGSYYPVPRFYAPIVTDDVEKSTQITFAETTSGDFKVYPFGSGSNWVFVNKMSTAEIAKGKTEFRIRIGYSNETLTISMTLLDGTEIFKITTKDANTAAAYSSLGEQEVIKSVTFSNLSSCDALDITNIYVKNGTTVANAADINNYALGAGWSTDAVTTWAPTFSYDQNYGIESLSYTNPDASTQTAGDWAVGYDVQWNSQVENKDQCGRIDIDIETVDGTVYSFDLQNKYYDNNGFYPVGRLSVDGTVLKGTTNTTFAFGSAGSDWIFAHQLSTKTVAKNQTDFRVRVKCINGVLGISVTLLDGTVIYDVSTAGTDYASTGADEVIKSVTISKGTDYNNQFSVTNVYVSSDSKVADTDDVSAYTVGNGWYYSNGDHRYAGVQNSTVTNDTVNVRFLTSVKSLDFDSLGVKIDAYIGEVDGTPDKYIDATVKTVYTSVVADGETVTAAELGGAYISAVEIAGVPAASDDTIVFVLTTSYVKDGETVTTGYYEIKYEDGEFQYIFNTRSELVGHTLNVMSFNMRYASDTKADLKYVNADGTLNAENLQAEEVDVTASRRYTLFINMLKGENIDILGVQEACNLWKAEFDDAQDGLAANGYSYVGVRNIATVGAGEGGYIIYKTEKFTLVDSGSVTLTSSITIDGQEITDGANNGRICSWALLQINGTDKYILVMDTHLSTTMVGSDYNASDNPLAAQQAKDIINKMNELMATYADKDVSLVITGDMNSNAKSETYGVFTAQLDNSRIVASLDTVASKYSTGTGFNQLETAGVNASNGHVIDYIFVSDDALVRNYSMIYTTTSECIYGEYISDHNAIIAQITF